MGKLDGKVAVVTGGSSGIGLAAAQAFVAEGASVAVFGRSRETLDAAIATLGDGAIAVQGDVASLDDLERLFATVAQALGRVDVLYVNAGIAKFAPLAGTEETLYDAIMDINVKGAFYTVQKALPVLNDGASVILTTSGANQAGLPNTSVYAASKAALRSLARTFSAELVERGIRVNAISPGPIETPIFGKLDLPQEAIEDFGRTIIAQVPLKRMGQPDEVAKAATFLASADSSYVVGAELVVDGGMTQL